jgi:hypothetical protein
LGVGIKLATGAFVFGATVAMVQTAHRLDRIPVDPQRPVTAFLPMSSINLRLTMSQIHLVARAQYGLELLPDGSMSPEGIPTSPARLPRMMPLDGMTIEAAIDAILAEAPQYTSVTAGQIVDVMPRRRTFLDQRVPEFSFSNRTMLESLGLFERLFDREALVRPPGGGWVGSFISSPNEDIAERMRLEAESRERRFSVNVKNVSARDVLNAICAAHGDLSWEVMYTGEPLDFAHSRIGLAGPTTDPMRNR